MAKLLVSDDDPQVLDLVTLVLEDAGHTVVATGDASAVHSLAAQPGIDAIILDVNMPKSGFEILNELRGDPATAALPILFLSGLDGREHRARGLVEGADDYMVKPFEAAELVLRVERMLPSGRFGRYQVHEVLGQGSMGTVHRGLDPRLERPVALKTLRFDTVTSEDQRRELLERLRHEAVTIARLSHPNIVAIYDMGDVERSAFIAMELVDGISLRDCLRTCGPLPVERLVPMAAAVASALALAHARGVIHRDVKPGNVLLGRDGAIKVSDFGLAFVVDSGEISGTPGYVPPEVLRSLPYTAAGDLFGLGATLYECLAGFHPLIGSTLRQTIANTLEGTFPPLSRHVPGAAGELEDLVTALLAAEPGARPSAAELEERLGRLAAERGFCWSAEALPAA